MGKKIKENSDCGCSGSCCGGGNKEIKRNIKCPVCNKKGVAVSYETARGIIKKSIKLNKDKNFFLCVNHDCDVSYFNSDDVFYLKDCFVDLDFKNKSKKRYACYCNKLTYNEVSKVIKETGNTAWSFVVKKAKGKINPSSCLTKNPFGKCCTSNSFKKAVLESGAKFEGGCI